MASSMRLSTQISPALLKNTKVDLYSVFSSIRSLVVFALSWHWDGTSSTPGLASTALLVGFTLAVDATGATGTTFTYEDPAGDDYYI